MDDRARPRIALVDDESLIVESFADEFADDFEVIGFTRPTEALRQLATEDFSVVIADFRMPEMDGITFLARLRQSRPEPPRILFTAFADMACLARAINEAEIFHFISKDSLGREGRHAEVAGILHHAAESCRLRLDLRSLVRRLTLDNDELRDENLLLSRQRPRKLGEKRFGDLIGDSPKLKDVIRRAKHAAGLDFPILIYGETGTGKEILSSAIHFESGRKDGPFISVNCGGIAKDLIGSELFGYAKGAFTGAAQDKRGIFELANRGTVFLDEIGEMPLEAQTHLLRVLEDPNIRPIGAAETRRIDVRVIAATNRDLQEEVESGKFRQDLWFRLQNGIKLTLPPLRERLDDLAVLAGFLLRQEDRMGAISRVSPAALDALRAYFFPGNVRELIGMIRRAIAEALLDNASELLPSHFAIPSLDEHSPDETKGLRAATAEARAQLISQALARNGNNITQAAAELKMSREGLSRLMGSLGIRKPAGR